MQRITSFACCRDFAGHAAALSSKTFQPWKRTSQTTNYAPSHQRAARRLFGQSVLWLQRQQVTVPPFAGQAHRQYGTDPGEEQGSKSPAISVVGIPDPLTWIRCTCDMFLIELWFELGLASVEFENGVKQAIVHVSQLMFSGKFNELRSVASSETVAYVKKKCNSLSDVQRQTLAVSLEDIVFLLPEDVSLVYEDDGRKFCFITMRFWFLSTLDGPDDPEATRIFRVGPHRDGSGPQRKIFTGVYEFRRELTTGAAPDWRITNIWHWHWTLTK